MPRFKNAAMSNTIAVLPRQLYVQVQSCSVAQAACDLELGDCGSIGHYGSDSHTVVSAAFGSGSGFTVSFRRHVQCMGRRSCAGIARDGPLRSRFLLLFPASNAFVDCEARGDTTVYRSCVFAAVCRIAERGAKEGHRIAQTRAR